MRMTVLFLPVSIVGGLIAGLIVAAVPGGRGAFLTVTVFTIAGTTYRLVLRSLARRGLLPIPDTSEMSRISTGRLSLYSVT
jgi:hypothetical protein